MGGTKVSDVELFDDFDVALLFCDMPATILNTWLARRVQVLTDLSSSHLVALACSLASCVSPASRL
jgi:hypothetical protein